MEEAGARSNSAFEDISSGVATAASSVDGVATSIETAAEQTEYWTEKIGNYDKSLMEATYSTEELVEQGYKSAEALEAATDATEEQSNAIEKGTQIMSEFRQTIEEQEAELSKLQEAYMGVTLIYGDSSEAAQSLKREIKDLSSVLEDNQKQLDILEKQSGKAGNEGVSAIEGISSALAAAGITAAVKEIAEGVYELANAFSEAESTVVLATGATRGRAGRADSQHDGGLCRQQDGKP